MRQVRIIAWLISPQEREITLVNGVVLKGSPVRLDEDAMRLAYTVIDDQVGLTDHSGTVQIAPSADAAHCTIVWITDVLPDGMGEVVQALMESAFPAIRQTL